MSSKAVLHLKNYASKFIDYRNIAEIILATLDQMRPVDMKQRMVLSSLTFKIIL